MPENNDPKRDTRPAWLKGALAYAKQFDGEAGADAWAAMSQAERDLVLMDLQVAQISALAAVNAKLYSLLGMIEGIGEMMHEALTGEGEGEGEPEPEPEPEPAKPAGKKPAGKPAGRKPAPEAERARVVRPEIIEREPGQSEAPAGFAHPVPKE